MDPNRERILAYRAKTAPLVGAIIAANAAKRAEEVEARKASAPCYDETVREFWSLVDTSGGIDACHPWLGAKSWNHPSNHEVRFERGVFKRAGFDSYYVTRIICFLTYGKDVPPGRDVTPLCEDHLCCNVRHFVITPEGGSVTGKKLNKGKPAEEFFCKAA